MCFRISSSAISRMGNGGQPSPILHTLENRRSRNPQHLLREPNRWPQEILVSTQSHNSPKTGMLNRLKPARKTAVSCKSDYFVTAKLHTRSAAWPLFTDD